VADAHRTALLTIAVGTVLSTVLGAASCTPAQPEAPTSVEWNSASEVSPTTLRVRWLGSACAEFDSTRVTETAQAVTISVLERSTGNQDHCTASGVLRSTDVPLEAPVARPTVLGCSAPPCLSRSAIR
jgi:hypothetical protein